MPRAFVRALGTALPERVLSNADLEKMVETSDEWIVSRTGIRERRLVEPGQGLSSLALPAAQQALEKAGLSAAELDGIIVGTISGDHIMPTTANLVQHHLGAQHAFAFDVANACTGFISVLTTASSFIEAGRAKNILVIGGDVMSSLVDYTDRNTCILFGDGAGAAVLSAGPDDGPGIIAWHSGSDGCGAEHLIVPASGSARPMNPDRLAEGDQYLHQDGRAVFKHAVRRMAEAATKTLAQAGVTGSEVDLLVPHQANLRIIEPTARRVGLPMEKVVVNIDRVANTTGGTIPLALADAKSDGRLQAGSRVLLVAFGGGFSWGGVYLTWGTP
jgi:3-oxoacyl-[acyl-carrier-protein] synthase-3